MDINLFISKTVNIYLVNLEDETGVLSTKTSDGITIETTNGFIFYPWQEITCVELLKQPQSKTMVSKKTELKITCSDEHLAKEKYKEVDDILPTDYEQNWNEENEDFTITDGDSNDVINVNLTNEQITVYYEKDFDLAKRIAETIEIYNVEKDYQDE